MSSSQPKYPPLERHHLRAIYERSRTQDVRTLIWEIVRLQRFVLKVDDLFRSMGRNRHANRFDGVSQKIVDVLCSMLMSEPAVVERDDDA